MRILRANPGQIPTLYLVILSEYTAPQYVAPEVDTVICGTRALINERLGSLTELLTTHLLAHQPAHCVLLRQDQSKDESDG